MPGLIGFTDRNQKYDKVMLSKMRALLKYSDSYVDDELFVDNYIYGSRSHLGVIDQGIQPLILGNRFCLWMEGEFYNQKELKSKYNQRSQTDNELLAKIYESEKSFDFLRDINGYFVAVIYDRKINKLFLITDRYGLKPLYWGIIDGDLVWSSELKGFLGHKYFKPTIDRAAVLEYFNFGYLLENRTWFEGLELVPPASVLSFEVIKSQIIHQQYWSWNDIKNVKDQVDEEEISRELARLFRQSVSSRVHENERIGIFLSGGLDSRAILAAIPQDYKPLHAFTFGQKQCKDIKIARKASFIKGATHHVLEINSKNWLMPRIKGVWKTDGSFSLLHMHGIEFENEYKQHVDIVLDGFGGDIILGGSHLKKKNLDRKVDTTIVKSLTHSNLVIKNFNSWYLISKTDPYFINNRVRRLTNSGLIMSAKKIEQRVPFVDNKLIDLIYSIPDSLRYDTYIYKKMLLMAFPEYFIRIPWQRTGVAINNPKYIVALMKLKKRILNKSRYELGKIGFKLRNLMEYTDYPSWIRQEPAKTFFKNVLLNKNSIFPEFIDNNKIQHYLSNHMSLKYDYHNELCLVLTFEIWLKQVFEKEYLL
jgi:asparagine synthase (glutamine-hydrolysing)